MGIEIDEKYMKKIECSFDSEKLLDLHVEIACAIIDKKKTDEIEHIINNFFK